MSRLWCLAISIEPATTAGYLFKTRLNVLTALHIFDRVLEREAPAKSIYVAVDQPIDLSFEFSYVFHSGTTLIRDGIAGRMRQHTNS